MGACCSVFDAPIDKTVYPEGGKKLRTDVTVEDVYRMGPQIGEGAYSKVRLATHRETGQHFACKIVPLPNPNQASNEHMSSRASIMRSHYSEADARTIFRQLIQAIQYLQSRGVVHRDIKLKNLLLLEPGDLNHVKLTDFGLSAKARQGQPHHMQTVCGTPGVVLFLLLSGVPPFSDPSEPRLMRAIAGGKYSFDDPAWEEISNEAKELVSQLLVVDPSKRLTCEQVLAHPWMIAAPGGEAELQQARMRLVAAHTRGGSKPLSDRIKAAIYRSEEAARAAAVKTAAAAAAPPPADSLPAAAT